MRFARAHRWSLALAVLAAPGLLGAAQSSPPEHPFGAGERADYQVKLGGISVGSGYLEVAPGLEVVGGEQTYHARMRVSGGLGPARVDDRYESWIDTDGLFSRRFRQNIHEVRYRRNRTYDFSPERMTYRRENGDTGSIASNRPLDDLSFMYYARTLPLEVGDEYTLNRYFKADGNPVVLKVLRKETVRVPAGSYRTIVVQPLIRTDGLFGEGGRAEIYFSDDEHRIPVLIRTRVPVVGSLSMHLRSFRPAP